MEQLNKKTQIILKSILAASFFLMVWFLIYMSTYSSSAAPKKNLKVVVEDLIIEAPALKNNKIGISDKKRVLICLPPSYSVSKERKYPVLYLLHGLGGGARAWVSEKAGRPNVKKALTALINKNEAKEMIVVIPDTNYKYIGCWYANSSLTGNWEDFITRDLISYIDKNYRTIAARKSRGIAGHSMGGYGALRIGMRNSSLFSVIYSMSPANASPSCISYFEGVSKSNLGYLLQKSPRTWNIAESVVFTLLLSFYPYQNSINELRSSLTKEHWRLLKSETLSVQLKKYKDDLIKQDVSLKIDIGTNDILIYQCRDLIEKLKEYNVEHMYEEYKGDHLNGLPWLVEDKLFQYFTKHLEG
jgi:enterochelin esterase-like enzyme